MLTKKVIHYIVVLLFTGAIGVSAADGNGFAGIPFGTPRSQVIEEILKRGLVHQAQVNTNQVVIPMYNLGDLPVEVAFRFNRQDKFFSYEIRTGKLEKIRFNKVLEAADYMTEQLEQLYGVRNRKFEPEMQELQDNRYAHYCLWENNNYDVLSLLRAVDARYFTQGIITHKALAREE